MCNCNDTSVCNQCQNGQPCNCPPDYTVLPQPTQGGCCPNGYQTFTAPTPNWPNGYCTDIATGKVHISAIPCTPCAVAVSTNCVTYQAAEGIPITCNAFGIIDGDTLTTIINKMCITLKSNIEAVLSSIGLDTDLESGLCQLVRQCPPAGSTTPIITTIIITFP